MEEIFNQLQKDGKNCVDNLIQWMKDSKLFDETKEAEEKARRLFSEIENKQNVELEKFKEILARIAEEHQRSVQQLNDTLSTMRPQLQDLQEALRAAADAFLTTLAKK